MNIMEAYIKRFIYTIPYILTIFKKAIYLQMNLHSFLFIKMCS